MKTKKRAQEIYEIGERLANDRHAHRSAIKAADSAAAVSDDLKRNGFRHVAMSDRTAHHLGVIAEAAGDIARRGIKPRHRRWPWLLGAGAVVAGGAAALRLRGGTTTVVGDSSSGKSIVSAVDVELPGRAAYDQWAQFEGFPTFM